jgi:transaldolase/glucose-6-phosphate isomerase
MFKKLFEESDKADGFVSLEVSPLLAHDTEKTISEARRLFAAVNRPNVMIKVPATVEGIPAIRQLLGEGINVNITLMFSMAHYESVAQAYIDGLTEWLDRGGNSSEVASVASFFVSRVDSAVDKKLVVLNDPAAEALRSAGAPVQRLLWASTSTKNPAYPDIMYIDELIGPETVNTMPPNTIGAFKDHGKVINSLEFEVDEAQLVLDNLVELGINLDEITEQLQADGVRAFANSFDSLMKTISKKVGASS